MFTRREFCKAAGVLAAAPALPSRCGGEVMAQVLIIKPIGIVTEPNKLANIPPGALTVNSLNTVMRSPGTVDAAKSWSTAQTISSRDRGLLFVVGKWILVFIRTTGGLWSYYWMDTNNGNALTFGPIGLTNFNAIDDVIDLTGRFGFVTVRDRSLLAAAGQIFVWDTINPTTLAQASATRTPGMPTPGVDFTQTNFGTGTAMKANMATCVTVVLRRVYSDGYEIFSAPAFYDWLGDNGGQTWDLNVTVRYSGANLQAGDYLDIYRTKSQSYTGTAGTNLGSDYFLATSHQLTSTEAGFNGLNVVSTTPDEALGEALYTNTAIAGGAGMALSPPSSKCLAYFRRHTFFGNYTQGAAWDVRVPVYWGFMGDSTGLPAGGRRNGIGERDFSATWAGGSAVLSAISAANMIGLTVGQILYVLPVGATVTGGGQATVVSVGATSVTLDKTLTGAGGTGATFGLTDVIEITFNGSVKTIFAADPQAFSSGVNFSLFEKFSVTGLGSIYPPTLGSYAISVVPSDSVSVFIRYIDGNSARSSFSVRATNGNNYVPQVPRIEASESPRLFSPTVVKNGLGWSEADQPEYFCGTNVDNVGKGELYALASTRDALWAFCSDGLWRWSGTGGDVAGGYDWRCDPVDSTLIIAGPQAYCVLRDTVFAFTTRGLVSISSDGVVSEISYGRCSDAMPPRNWVMTAFPTQTSSQQFDGSNAFYLVADEQNGEVIIRLKDADFTTCTWTYNVHTDAITRDTPNNGTMLENHSVWNPTNNRIYVAGTSSTNIVVASQNTSLASGWTVELQPITVDDPFTMRQFLQLEVTFESDLVGTGTVVCYFNGNSGVTETRTPVVVAGGAGPGTIRRTSFAVPRNSPAVSNVISANIRVNGLGSATYARFLGAALKYSTPTEQRKDR